MKKIFTFAMLALALSLPSQAVARSTEAHIWTLVSPNHGQTFSYGSEINRAWTTLGKDNHLAVYMTYTNDPYVDRNNPRQTDYFTFNFPQVLLGKDGRTFHYKTKDGRLIDVAVKKRGFLGIEQINLTPNTFLNIKKKSGYLTFTLVVQDRPYRTVDDWSVFTPSP